jgi:hypothetical protein
VLKFSSLKCRRRIPARLRAPKTLHIPFDAPIVVVSDEASYLPIITGFFQLRLIVQTNRRSDVTGLFEPSWPPSQY